MKESEIDILKRASVIFIGGNGLYSQIAAVIGVIKKHMNFGQYKL